MKIKREGGERRKFGGVGREEGENCDRQFKNQVVCKKNSNIKLLAKKFKHIYCKYLHGE